VFGSNTLARSWETFRQAIHQLITSLSQRDDLIKKHKDLLNILRWVEEDCSCPELVRAFAHEINHSKVLDLNDNIIPIIANIYVDDILTTAAFQDKMLTLLMAIIEAIFFVCGAPDILVHQ
jgi:hypothetical protein